MKVTGIIAEYNPFHNGHAYHIEETKKGTEADYIVAVMSGNFVQRGAPAILTKYERAKMALENGADLVIELPVTAALSSAEGFAAGGVSLLNNLGVVNTLSFGTEASSPEETDTLQTAANLLSEEPEEFQMLLFSYLKQGNSFPAARMKAVTDYFEAAGENTGIISSLLSSPNNILAIEYLKAIKRYHSGLTPFTITRKGKGYHDTELSCNMASATGIRKFLLGQFLQESKESLSKAVPSSVYQSLCTASSQNCFLRENDFSAMLYYALTTCAQKTEPFLSSAPDLELRIRNLLEQFASWSQFAILLKSKNQTYTAISRYLTHVLLGIGRDQFELAADFHFAPYARILGFRRDSAPLLKEIQKRSRIPVITRLAKDCSFLTPKQKELLNLDIHASELYNYIRTLKSGQQMLSDYRQPLIYIG